MAQESRGGCSEREKEITKPLSYSPWWLFEIMIVSRLIGNSLQVLLLLMFLIKIWQLYWKSSKNRIFISIFSNVNIPPVLHTMKSVQILSWSHLFRYLIKRLTSASVKDCTVECFPSLLIPVEITTISVGHICHVLLCNHSLEKMMNNFL